MSNNFTCRPAATILGQIESKAQERFTGSIDFPTVYGDYIIYFSMGRLAWAKGAQHTQRLWRRNLVRYCSKINLSEIQTRQADTPDSREYYQLVTLLRRHLITPEQAINIIRNTIQEVLFDLLHAISINSEQESPEVLVGDLRIKAGLRPAANYVLPSALTLDFLETMTVVQHQWQQWQEFSDHHISPNQTLILKDAGNLAKKMGEKAFRNLSALTTGQHTIRDIAWVLRKAPWEVMQIMASYLNSGSMETANLPDLNQPLSSPFPSAETTETIQSIFQLPSQPLIACIDDSESHCLTMRSLLQSIGCRSMCVVNEVNAMLQLLNQVPDLIFLDLLMPVINGYELCSQIRRVKQLADVPVVVLTSRNGVVDRARAKLVGASDFLPKPVELDQLQAILDKYSLLPKAA